MSSIPRGARSQEDLVASLRIAFDLHEAGVEMTRLRLRRKHPDLDEAAISALVAGWLSERPSDDFEGSSFRRVPWPRTAG